MGKTINALDFEEDVVYITPNYGQVIMIRHEDVIYWESFNYRQFNINHTREAIKWERYITNMNPVTGKISHRKDSDRFDNRLKNVVKISSSKKDMLKLELTEPTALELYDKLAHVENLIINTIISDMVKKEETNT